MRLLLAALALAGALFLAYLPAHAHDAPAGWAYPWDCCHDQDCHELPAAAVSEDALGFTVQVDGGSFFIAHDKARLSPDGRFHACHTKNTAFIRCFFYPPRATWLRSSVSSPG